MALAKRKIRTSPRPKSADLKLGTAALRKAGGSLVMIVPASARDALQLSEGSRLDISLADDHLVLRPAAGKPSYTLEELVAQCDFDVPYTDEERAFLDAPPVGRELL